MFTRHLSPSVCLTSCLLLTAGCGGHSPQGTPSPFMPDGTGPGTSQGTGGGVDGSQQPQPPTGTFSGICRLPDWQSGLEIHRPLPQGQALEALATAALGSAPLRGFTRKGPLLRWTTTYEDVVFAEPQAGRVVVVSRCPIQNLSMIRRLDEAVYPLVPLIARTDATAKGKDLAGLVAGPRRYYNRTPGVYSRVILAAWSNGRAEGYLRVPALNPLRAVALGTGGFGRSYYWGPLSINDKRLREEELAPIDDDECISRAAPILTLNPGGTFKYSLKTSSWSSCDNWDYSRGYDWYIWFEAAGEGNELISADVAGGQQPVEAVLPFQDLQARLPETP